jgi:pyruvyltransferase
LQVRNRAIRLYYMTRPNGMLNFGDDLSPILYTYASGRDRERSDLADCDVIGLGSLLQEAVRSSQRWRLKLRALVLRRARPVVWGTGIIDGRDVAGTDHLSVASVRGPLTAARIAPGCTSFGDPGLLVGEWFQERRKTHAIGIVPHYVDEGSAGVAALSVQFPDCRVISVNAPAAQVVKAISECDLILSSSLHGLIVADTMGIPNARMQFSKSIKGGDFKFADYGASVGRGALLSETLTGRELITAVEGRDFGYQSGIPAMARMIRAAVPA